MADEDTLDPDPAESEDDFEERLRRKANYDLEKLVDRDEPIEEVIEGEDIANDGEPADAVDPDGVGWRIKVKVVATRHRILPVEDNGTDEDPHPDSNNDGG